MYEKLRKLGLGKYEAKLYQVLCAHGRLNAKQLATYSAVPPTAVYPNIKSLVAKGLIQSFQGKVTFFETLPPQTAFAYLIGEKKKRLNQLQGEITAEAAAIFHSKVIEKEKEVLRLTHGREISTAIYDETLRKVRRSFFILGWRMEQITDKYERLRNFRRAVKKGVDIRLILVGSPQKQWSVVKAYQDAGIKIRYMPLENFSIFIADGKECKITLKGKDMPQRYNLQILHEPLAKALEFYFLQVWERAQELTPENY